MKRTLVTWSFLLAAFALSGWFLSEATEPIEQASRYADSGSTFTLTAPRMREIGPEGVRLIARADEARYTDQRIVADRLAGEVHRDGKTTRITAATGTYQVESTTATLAGGVTVAADDGYVFTTASAVYHHDRRLLSAAGAFTAEGNGLSLRGNGLHYDILNDTFRIDRNVGATISRFTF